jgi:hypothetical protein
MHPTRNSAALKLNLAGGRVMPGARRASHNKRESNLNVARFEKADAALSGRIEGRPNKRLKLTAR